MSTAPAAEEEQKPSEMPVAGTREEELKQELDQQLQRQNGTTKPPEHRRRRASNASAMQRGLSVAGMSLRIPANHDAKYTVEETHGIDHWKTKIFHFLHSDPVQYTLMALLLLDVAILFVELFLQATYPPCHFIERDAISCCPVYDLASNATAHDNNDLPAEDEHHFRRFLAGDDDHHNLCMHSSVESHEYEATCDPHKWDGVHKTEKALFALTLTILSTFLVELIIMMLILQRAFFSQFFYVLDFFIVATSLGLEILFKTLDQDALISVAGLLVFGRIWRFVRIGHGLVEVTAEYAHKDKEALLKYAEALEDTLKTHEIDLPKESKRVKHIKDHNTNHSFNSEH